LFCPRGVGWSIEYVIIYMGGCKRTSPEEEEKGNVYRAKDRRPEEWMNPSAIPLYHI